ncbi:polysaccharide biosynthesis tyrosine autokinase [Fimbriiglobus ruber]|uniref:Tyrosine-protein kinase EpsD n=1 Tax=Fimbriiglobus ruber TaxID=1908690 RepID=A0A225EH48_9BACT|nr:polysaccharide biosynthesis tyrosine autokinase [Fimbriiglobus ruber]OWK47517.1 Tyrosine-protein kinase EpsD [Fimbriiglobus ruber]
MQRSSASEAQMPIPLTPAQPSGQQYASGFQPSVPGQTLAPTAAARAWPTLPELVNALKRRLVLATFLGMLVGMAAAAAVWLALPSGKHTAMALIQLKPIVSAGKQSMGEDFESFKQTQMRLLKTRMLLDRVVSNPNVSRLPDIKGTDDPVTFLEDRIKLRWGSPEILEVSMNGDDPKQILLIVNTMVDEYIKDADSDERQGRQRRRKIIEAHLETLNRLIKSREDRLKDWVKLGQAPGEQASVLKMKLLTDEVSKFNSTVSSLSLEIVSHETNLITLQHKQSVIDMQEVSLDELEKAVAKNEKVAPKVEARNIAIAQFEKLKTAVKEDSPLYAREKDHLAKLEEDLRTTLEEFRSKVEADIRAALKREIKSDIEREKQFVTYKTTLTKKLGEEIKRLEKELELARGANVQGIIDLGDLGPLKEQRAAMEKERLDLDLLDRSDSRIQLRQPAVVSQLLNIQKKILCGIAAFFAGFLLIALAVAFLEWRSRRVDSVDQVVNELGLRVIGTIPAFPSKSSLRSGDAGQAQNWRFVLNESVNSARTMLLHTAKTQNMQVLMVTSAMQGEGKTSLASQLATSMATAGLRTLVLDCDLRNPSLHKLFDSPLTPGCAEVLLQEVDVSDAVQPTTVPNLWLIPAGQCSNRVIAALAQGHPLETLFNRLRGQFDFIVVDSCPVLPVADALLVGQHVDGVVISILQDISQLPKVLTASEKLTQLNIPLLGAVVNGIKPDIHAYGYNYVKQLPA